MIRRPLFFFHNGIGFPEGSFIGFGIGTTITFLFAGKSPLQVILQLALFFVPSNWIVFGTLTLNVDATVKDFQTNGRNYSLDVFLSNIDFSKVMNARNMFQSARKVYADLLKCNFKCDLSNIGTIVSGAITLPE